VKKKLTHNIKILFCNRGAGKIYCIGIHGIDKMVLIKWEFRSTMML